MKRYTLKVDNGDNMENIWSGDDYKDALHYEAIGIKHWGRTMFGYVIISRR
jgi:hypothetical protein